MTFLYYQNIDGSKREKAKLRDSAFWNEGKWKNFIEPFLPSDCSDMTFIDVGCNAGLHLKLAEDKGFRTVIGIEPEPKTCLRGEAYRDKIGYNYKIINDTIDSDFDFKNIPLADYTLLSNVHYYLELGSWLKYLDALRTRTCYCIVVSRYVTPKINVPGSTTSDIKYYFREWEQMNAIYKIRYGFKEIDDPCPRELQSYLFRGRLERKKISELHTGAKFIKIRNKKISKREIVDGLLKVNNESEFEKTLYFTVLRKLYGKRWGKDRILAFIKGKYQTLENLKKEGLKDPILIKMDNKLIDGGHRIRYFQHEGYKSVITRRI